MKIKTDALKLMTALLLGCVTITSQAKAVKSDSLNLSEKYNREAIYLQLIGGANASMNEDIRFGKFSNSIKWGGEISIGTLFTPFWSGSLSLGYNKNVGSLYHGVSNPYYTFNSLDIFADVHYNLLNGLMGLKARRSDLFLNVGVGAAYTSNLQITTNNDNNYTYGLRAGMTYSYRFCRNLSAVANFTIAGFGDSYNGRSAEAPFDLRMNLMVGLRLHLGKKRVYNTDGTRVEYIETGAPVAISDNPEATKVSIGDGDVIGIVERADTIVTEVQDTATVKSTSAVIYSVFFSINSSEIKDSELAKLKEMGEYLRENKDKSIFITGHADKATGNKAINYKLGKDRSQSVAKWLTDNYGIEESRIVCNTEEGDIVQPYKSKSENNRVAICIITDFSDMDE